MFRRLKMHTEEIRLQGAIVAQKITGDYRDGAKVSFWKTLANEFFDQRKIYRAFKPDNPELGI